MEGNDGSGLVGVTDYTHLIQRLALRVVLDENLAFTVNLSGERIRERIHAGYTHTVKTSGNLVAVFAELAAGVKDGQNDFEG